MARLLIRLAPDAAWAPGQSSDERSGKTVGRTDTYHGRFVELVPNELIVEADEFETSDPALRGEMTITISSITLVAQDWGGPIGFAVATRQPERFAAFVIGNTWAWPVGPQLSWQLFSRIAGGPIGRRLIQHRNLFVEVFVPRGVVRRPLEPAVMDHYRGPFPTPASRRPVAVLPGEILHSTPFLAEVERGLPRLAERPALILWPGGDAAFGRRQRERWERIFPTHRTVILPGVGHYFPEDAPEHAVATIRSWIA